MEGRIINQLIDNFLKSGEKCFIGVEASDGGSRRNYNGFILDSDGENILFNDQFIGEIGIAISEIKRITSANEGGGR